MDDVLACSGIFFGGDYTSKITFRSLKKGGGLLILVKNRQNDHVLDRKKNLPYALFGLPKVVNILEIK